MLILGIETSGDEGAVALMENGLLLGERTLAGKGRKHAQALTAEMALLFQETGRKPADCGGVAVSVGPGSFTGLRIGVTCAKTLAYAVGCPIAAVDTLQAIVEDCPPEWGRVVLIADAARGDLYVGDYRFKEGQWNRLGTIEIHPAEVWIRSRDRAWTIAGPGLSKWITKFPDQSSLRPEYQTARARRICEIGSRQFEAGQIAGTMALEPFYLRKSSAEEQWERRQQKN